jgi:periplasmic divalent cation tolerance protein
MGDYLLVSTTTARAADARRIARSVVESRLAACAQIVGPVSSSYRWQGRVTTAHEWLCLIKTSRRLFPRLEREVSRIHPYDTPEIVAVPIAAGSRRYLTWLKESLEPARRKEKKLAAP